MNSSTGSDDGLGRVWENYYDSNILMINYKRREEGNTLDRDSMVRSEFYDACVVW